MKIFKNILSFILPKWLAADISSYLFHPYWRRKIVEIPKNSNITSAGITSKEEKFSSRNPFKNIDKDEILNYFRKNNVRSILDVGCGIGNLTKYLSDIGFDVTGININKLEIERACHNNIFLYDIQETLRIAHSGIKNLMQL